MAVSLVRNDLQYYFCAAVLLVALYYNDVKMAATAVAWTALCTLCFWVLHFPGPVLARYVDASISRYLASLLVWIGLGTMSYSLIKGLIADTVPTRERVFLAATVAVGVGAQSILANFASGLLLVLFRPFRVGDDVSACGETFTVESITAFFTHGTDFNNIHVVIPNEKVIAGTISNWSSNPTIMLKLGVCVRVGQHKTAMVRQALVTAGQAFDEGLVDVLLGFGITEDVAKALPKCAVTGVYGPTEVTEYGAKWMLKPHVPELAMLRCIDHGYACILDAFMDAGIEVYEAHCADVVAHHTKRK